MGEHKRSVNFQREWITKPWMKLWYRGKEVLINKVLDLTHTESLKKTMKTIKPILDTVKLCATEYSSEWSQGCKK